MVATLKQYQSQQAQFSIGSSSNGSAFSSSLSPSASSSYDDDDEEEDFALDFGFAGQDRRSASPIQVQTPSAGENRKPAIFIGDASDLVLKLNDALKSTISGCSQTLLRLREDNNKSMDTVRQQHDRIAADLESKIQDLTSESKRMKVSNVFSSVFFGQVFTICSVLRGHYRKRKRSLFRRYKRCKGRCRASKSKAEKNFSS